MNEASVNDPCECGQTTIRKCADMPARHCGATEQLAPPVTDINALIAEMRAGLEGVTPGPWQYFECEPSGWREPGQDAAMVNDAGDKVIDCTWASATEEGERTYRHIARCHPSNIAALITEIERLHTIADERLTLCNVYLTQADRAGHERDKARALIAKLSDPDMYWAGPDNDYCDHGSFDYANTNPGIVVQYDCAHRLPPVFVVTLPEDDGNEEPLWDEWFFSGDTRENALTALAAERVRRAMLMHPPTEDGQ